MPFLLEYPNADDPLNKDAANEFKSDKDKFFYKVIECYLQSL